MSDGKSLPELKSTARLHSTDELLVNAAGQPRRATVGALFASHGLVYVNDFGAIADGRSHPLSETYSSFADAKKEYPKATTLLDEKDWCAWQAASDFIYDRDDTQGPENWSSGHLIADGRYVVNKTITLNHAGVIVEGTNPATGAKIGGGTSITYNGPNGSLDHPVYILDFFLFDEFGAPPTGRKGNTVQSGGGRLDVRNITFFGKSGDMRADAVNVSGFVSGIRVRKASYVHIAWCNFAGTLWDGVKFTDAQLFTKVESNNFYGVHRDAIAFDRGPNFSTTTWLWWNEFGFVGRYAMLIDMSGSVEAMPIISDNSFEHSYDSFFTKHPEWFVQGLVSGVCIIGGGNAMIQKNRFESVTDQPPFKHWADLHFVCTTRPSIRDGIHRNLAFTAVPAKLPWRTEALISYYKGERHTDITELRNYNVGTADDHWDCEAVQIENIYNLGKVLTADGAGLSTSNTHSAKNVGLQFWSIPVEKGPAGKVVQPRDSAVLSLTRPKGNWILSDVVILDTTGVRAVGQSSWALSDYSVGAGAGLPWQQTHKYSLNGLATPSAENGFFYQVVVEGVSATSEPVWPKQLGSVIPDGTVVWRCAGTCSLTSEARTREWQMGGTRNQSGTRPPEAGSWAQGDKIWNSRPTAGGNVGWVCVAAGSPGAWKKFGSIED